MKIGDLVRYGSKLQHGWIGIVVNVHRNSVVTVLWNNGVESNHSSGWVVRIKETT
jgi:hypothetical protein